MKAGGRGSWHWFVSLFRNLTSGARRDDELDADVRAYVDLLTDEKIRSGLSPAAARRAALVEAGGLESAKEQTRMVRAGAWPAELWRDVQYACRLAQRTPTFFVAAVLILALGIGANTAVFSVVNGVLLRDLPYGDANRVVRFQNVHAQGEFGISERERLIYAAESSIFERFSTYGFSAVNVTGTGDAERLVGAFVDANTFETLEVGAMRGRLFEAADGVASAGAAVVLAEGFWTRRFGRDEAAIGRSLTLNGQARTVVGILPGDVRLPGDFTGSPADVYLPLVFAGPPDPENIHYLEGVARLRDGIPLAEANRMIAARADEVRRELTTLPSTYSARLIPVADVVFGDVRPGLVAVSAAVGLLLLIACGNLAGLLLARSQQRTTELSLRSALGASRGRLVRQLLTESVVLALAGASLGAGLAVLGTRALVVLAPDLPRLDRVHVDGAALLFTAALAVGTGLVFGLAPALALSRRGGVRAVLTGSGRVASSGMTAVARRALVAGQVALSVTLAIGAGLLARSASSLDAVPPGFDPGGVLTMRITLPESSYPDRTATQRFVDDTLADLRALPGVIAAGATTHLPLVDDTGDWGLMIDGLPERDEGGRTPNADWSAVSDGYFEAMGIRVIEGRGYVPGDVAGAPPVTIISERMAREYFPGRSALGQRMRMRSTIDPVYRQVVGVVSDVHHDGLDTPPVRQMYLPLSQFPSGPQAGGGSRSLVVRSDGDPMTLAASIRARIRERDASAPVAAVTLMDDVVAESTSAPRLYLALFGIFSMLAIAIVSVGMYGVAAYLVATRRRELAVRRALGATSAAIVGLVLKEGATLALVGVAVGIPGALLLSGLVDSLLFGVTGHDPLTFTVMPAVVVVVTVVANLLPAGRAIRENPTIALRT